MSLCAVPVFSFKGGRNGFRRHGGSSLLLVLLANTKSSIYGDLGAKPLLSVVSRSWRKLAGALPGLREAREGRWERHVVELLIVLEHFFCHFIECIDRLAHIPHECICKCFIYN